MFGGLVPKDAIVFTDFQWVTFHLDEESAPKELIHYIAGTAVIGMTWKPS